MGVKIKDIVINSDNYVYSIILISREYPELYSIHTLIYYTIKGFLKLFSISKFGIFGSGSIIQGIFKKNGILSYWIKGKCKTLIINDIPRYQLDTLINRCKDLNIPTYSDINFNTKECVGLYIAPYWTNKLYYNLENRIIQDEFNEILNIENTET